MKKEVLLISYSYPPANVPAAQRPYSIAKYLNKEKYNVTVLTCSNQDSSLGFDNTFNESLNNVNLIKVNGIKISSNRATVKSNTKKGILIICKQFIFKFLSYFVFPDKAILWFPKVIRFIKKNKSDLHFDIIFSTSPLFTNHLIARKIIKKTNLNTKHIADFRDFHYLENHELKKGLKTYLNKKIEKLIIKKADKITFISEAMQKEYTNYYKPFSYKFHTIYNGFDIQEYQKNDIVLKNDVLKIFYAGSFYKGVRNPIPLLNILENLLNQSYINSSQISIEIAGNFETTLINEIKDLQVFKCMKFLGQLPRNEVLKKYKESHLLWLIVANKVSHYTGVPIKFYEYLGSQRSIINFAPANSEPTKIINELDLGWNFDTENLNLNNNISKFKTIVNLFKNGKLAKPLQLNNINKYSRKEQTKKLELLF